MLTLIFGGDTDFPSPSSFGFTPLAPQVPLGLFATGTGNPFGCTPLSLALPLIVADGGGLLYPTSLTFNIGVGFGCSVVILLLLLELVVLPLLPISSLSSSWEGEGEEEAERERERVRGEWLYSAWCGE